MRRRGASERARGVDELSLLLCLFFLFQSAPSLPRFTSTCDKLVPQVFQALRGVWLPLITRRLQPPPPPPHVQRFSEGCFFKRTEEGKKNKAKQAPPESGTVRGGVAASVTPFSCACWLVLTHTHTHTHTHTVISLVSAALNGLQMLMHCFRYSGGGEGGRDGAAQTQNHRKTHSLVQKHERDHNSDAL